MWTATCRTGRSRGSNDGTPQADGVGRRRPAPDRRGGGGHDAGIEHDRVQADQWRRDRGPAGREELPDPGIGRGSLPLDAVREPEAVAEALRELWGKAGVKSKQVYLGVGNQRVVVREVAIPWLPERELRETLAFQVQEFIPMSSDEAVLDYDPLGEIDQGGRRMQRILLVAAHKAMIGSLVEAALSAKLEPFLHSLSPPLP